MQLVSLSLPLAIGVWFVTLALYSVWFAHNDAAARVAAAAGGAGGRGGDVSGAARMAARIAVHCGVCALLALASSPHESMAALRRAAAEVAVVVLSRCRRRAHSVDGGHSTPGLEATPTSEGDAGDVEDGVAAMRHSRKPHRLRRRSDNHSPSTEREAGGSGGKHSSGAATAAAANPHEIVYNFGGSGHGGSGTSKRHGAVAQAYDGPGGALVGGGCGISHVHLPVLRAAGVVALGLGPAAFLAVCALAATVTAGVSLAPASGTTVVDASRAAHLAAVAVLCRLQAGAVLSRRVVTTLACVVVGAALFVVLGSDDTAAPHLLGVPVVHLSAPSAGVTHGRHLSHGAGNGAVDSQPAGIADVAAAAAVDPAAGAAAVLAATRAAMQSFAVVVSPDSTVVVTEDVLRHSPGLWDAAAGAGVTILCIAAVWVYNFVAAAGEMVTRRQPTHVALSEPAALLAVAATVAAVVMLPVVAVAAYLPSSVDVLFAAAITETGPLFSVSGCTVLLAVSTLASWRVLSSVGPVHHAVLSVLARVFVALCLSVAATAPLSVPQVLGMALALVGSVTFSSLEAGMHLSTILRVMVGAQAPAASAGCTESPHTSHTGRGGARSKSRGAHDRLSPAVGGGYRDRDGVGGGTTGTSATSAGTGTCAANSGSGACNHAAVQSAPLSLPSPRNLVFVGASPGTVAGRRAPASPRHRDRDSHFGSSLSDAQNSRHVASSCLSSVAATAYFRGDGAVIGAYEEPASDRGVEWSRDSEASSATVTTTVHGPAYGVEGPGSASMTAGVPTLHRAPVPRRPPRHSPPKSRGGLVVSASPGSHLPSAGSGASATAAVSASLSTSASASSSTSDGGTGVGAVASSPMGRTARGRGFLL